MKHLFRLFAVALFLAASLTTLAADAPPDNKPTLYVVGYAHLDTQWRWSYPQVIAEFLRSTMEDNFNLFEQYPHYIFNFSGANRYLMMKEYFPEDFKKLQAYVKAGRWFPCGSSMEEGDVNMPNGESIIRQVLYGNEIFRKEFGVASNEFMLPDCFGFQASLPSVLAHCGVKGFSTQKLTWGSAVGIPFNVGVWVGPDGKEIVSALNCGAYDAKITTDLSQDKTWLKRINADGAKSGVYVDYRYYGVGDRGGAVGTRSAQWIEKAATDKNGPIRVISSKADQMFNDLTPAQVKALPRYTGDLLLTNHSAGSLSSQGFVKRTNRKLEELGDAAERAAVTADWLGSSPYPYEKLFNAWTLQLGAHFHDTMAGTALPKAYEYTWNNMVLALNQFAAVAQDSVGGVVSSMDTRGDGVPIIIYNPLSVDRDDVAEATIPTQTGAFTVSGPDGKSVPCQVLSSDAAGTRILFEAKVPSISFSVFSVHAGAADAATDLKAGPRELENARFKVTLNDGGDIASIFDKVNNKEILSAPARLEFLHENPKQYPAWNMDWDDRRHAPLGYVDGPCTFKIVEDGPVRVAIETERHARGSTVTQQIRLSTGEAGDKVEVVNHINWQTREVSLEAVFPMTVSNPNATYESQSAAVQRGNNNEKKFEVPQQQWLDLTAADGSYGTAILNDCKYGSDKPDDSTIRLTLIYTPGTQAGYQDQGTQDLGRNEFTYAIAPHAGSWQQAKIPWSAQRLNQPLMTFGTAAHEGSLGKSMSVAKTSKSDVSIYALKKAEAGDEYIVRLHETDGVAAEGTAVSFSTAITSAREVDGQEREIGNANLVDGKLVVDMGKFGLRAFAIKLAPPAAPAVATVSQPVELPYDLDAISTHTKLDDGGFDAAGHTYAAEGLPAKIESEGIQFTMGPTADGKNNALLCKGQTINLPAGNDRVYVLASAIDGDAEGTFQINGKDIHQTVQDWSGNIGQWDNRIWQGVVPELTYNFVNKFVGLVPGFIKRDTVAWFYSHRHDPSKGNEYYKFSYLFKYGFDLPPGATSITLPNNDKIRIFAMTVAKNTHDHVSPGRALYDTLQDHQYGSPAIVPAAGSYNNVITCSIERSLYGRPGDIHYTTDGSEPTADSPLYSRPIFLGGNTTVRARQFDAGKAMGPETSQQYVVDDKTPPTVSSASALTITPAVSIGFSEPVTRETAEAVANYKIQPAVEVTAAKLDEDGTTVTLALAKPLAEGAKLTVTGVKDLSAAGNAIVPTETAISTLSPIAHVEKFVADGKSEQTFRANGLSGRGSASWTLSFFVKPNGGIEDRTIIAGFGTNEDRRDGQGRFICKFAEGIHYWSRNQDVTGTPFDIGKWQLITATYDGTVLRLYKDARQIGEQSLSLGNDDATVRLAPTDAWEHSRRFKGEFRDFTIWSSALTPEQIKAMMPAMPE